MKKITLSSVLLRHHINLCPMPFLSRRSPAHTSTCRGAQVGCSTREGRPGAKGRSKVGRGNDLTGEGWSPTVPKQGQQSKTSDGGNYPKGSSRSPGAARQVHDHRASLRSSQEVKAARPGQDQQNTGLTIAGFSFIVSSVRTKGKGLSLNAASELRYEGPR